MYLCCSTVYSSTTEIDPQSDSALLPALSVTYNLTPSIDLKLMSCLEDAHTLRVFSSEFFFLAWFLVHSMGRLYNDLLSFTHRLLIVLQSNLASEIVGIVHMTSLFSLLNTFINLNKTPYLIACSFNPNVLSTFCTMMEWIAYQLFNGIFNKCCSFLDSVAA